MAHDPSSGDARQHVALIQQMWLELQGAARKDPEHDKTLAERIRQETDRLRQKGYHGKSEA
jgi:hypothetical protein